MRKRIVTSLILFGVFLVLSWIVLSLEPSTEEGDARVSSGMEHFHAGRFEEAAAELQAALDAPATTEPRVDILVARGMSLSKLKKYGAAIPVLEEAVAKNAHHRKAWTALGLAHAGNKDFDKAASAYQKALALDPTEIETLINVGALEFRRTGDPSRAIPLLKKATEVHPHSMLAWFNLSGMALAAGDCETAVPAGLRARDEGMSNFAELAAKLVAAGCSVPDLAVD